MNRGRLSRVSPTPLLLVVALREMNNLIRLVIDAGIKPEIGAVLPTEEAKKATLAMIDGRTHGKTIFTR